MASRGIELAFSLMGKISPEFIKAAKGATSHLAAVNKEAAAVARSANNRAMKRAWKDFTSSAKNAKRAVSGIKSEIGGVVKAAAGLALGKGVVGGAIYGVARSSAGYADNAIKTAQSIGMTTEAYSELSYAAQMAGVSEQQFGMASMKMSGLLADAAKGQESALDIFKRAQIDYLDEAGNLKSVERIWGEFSNKIASMEDGQWKTNLVSDMLGDKMAIKMIPFLNGAKKGMDEAREAAKKMGISLSEQDGLNAEAFNDSFANIKASMQGVSLIAGKHLWPIFTDIHNFISGKIVQAGQELAKKMPEWTERFKEGWNDLVPELEKAWESIKSGAVWIDGIAQKMGGWVPLVKTLMKTWLAWRGIRLAGAFIKTGFAVKDLGKKFLDLQYSGVSVGGALSALGGKIKGLFKGSEAIPKEGLQPFSGSLRKSLKNAFSSAYSTAGRAAKGLGRYTKTILSKSFDGVSAAVKGIGKGATFLGGGMKDIGRSAGRGMKSFFKSIPGMARTAGGAVRDFSSATWLGVRAAASFSKTMVISAGKGIAGFASTIAAKALPMLSGMATALYAGAAAAVKFGIALMANPIGLAIAGIAALGGAIYLCVKHWDKIKAAVSAAWEAVKGVFVSGWNFLPSWIQEPLAGMAGAISGFGKKVWLGIVKDWEGIKGVFSNAWAGIVGIAASFGAMLKDGISAIWNGISGIFSERFEKIGDAFENSFIGGLLETARQFSPLSLFIDAFTAVKDWIMEFDLAQAGAELARKLGDGILNAWSGIKDSIKSAVVDWIPGGESIMKGIGAASDAVSGAYNTVTGWFGGSTEAATAAATIPAYANGGIITSPQIALIGEAGPEVVIPLSRPERAQQLLTQAAGMMGAAGGRIREQVAPIVNFAHQTAAPALNFAQDAAAPVVRLLNSVAGSVFNNSIMNSSMSNTATMSYWPQKDVPVGISNTADFRETNNIVRFLTENQAVNNAFSGNKTTHQNWLSNLSSTANTRMGDIYSSAKQTTTGGVQNIINAISQVIPAFADGGLVTAPQLAMIGEAGPEMIVPLTRENRARDLMGQAAEFMGWSDGGGTGGGDTFEFTYAPVFHINGGDSNVVRQIERLVESKKSDRRREFETWFREMRNNERRTGNH